MQCVLKYHKELHGKCDWFAWCGKKMINSLGYNYSFIASLDACDKNDVCFECSMAIIRKLLCVIDKEHLAMLI